MTIWKIRCSEVVIENGILMVTLRCSEDSSQEKIKWKLIDFVPVFESLLTKEFLRRAEARCPKIRTLLSRSAAVLGRPRRTEPA
jgi:hypothetical protein